MGRVGAIALSIALAVIGAIRPYGTRYANEVGVAAESEPPLLRLSQQPGCTVDLEPTIAQLVEDLPGYANRVIRRSRSAIEMELDTRSTYIVRAGRVEFEPLPLGASRSASISSIPDSPEFEDLHQVFVTTLERVYTRDRMSELQQFHWLFLARTPDGWRLAMMYSRTEAGNGIMTPPRDSSHGAIAKAVRLWLRDCRMMGFEEMGG